MKRKTLTLIALAVLLPSLTYTSSVPNTDSWEVKEGPKGSSYSKIYAHRESGLCAVSVFKRNLGLTIKSGMRVESTEPGSPRREILYQVIEIEATKNGQLKKFSYIVRGKGQSRVNIYGDHHPFYIDVFKENFLEKAKLLPEEVKKFLRPYYAID